jgi:putative membrane protein
MTNRKLIESAHVWVLAAFVSVVVFNLALQNKIAQGSVQENSNSNTASRSQNKNSASNKNSSASKNASATGEAVSNSALSAKDKKFMMDTAMGGMMEVEISKWAVQQGGTDAVKEFARKMVTDHSAANAELTQLATSKAVTLPTQLDAKHQAEISRMSKLSGAAFDQAYSKMMLKDHTKVVADFEKQSTSASDADVKAFASKALPTLKEHLELAKSLNPKPATPPAKTTTTKP